MITLEDIVNANAMRGSELHTWVQLSEKNGVFMSQPLPLNDYMADDKLYCGEAWHDYGNFKKFFPNGCKTLVEMWDFNAGDRQMCIYDTETGKAYSVIEEGSYSHSESCDDPRRRAFGKELESLPEYFSKTLDFYLENFQYYSEHFQEAVDLNYEMQLKNRLLKVVMESEQCVKEYLDLQLNHPRAWKKIQLAQEKADRIQRYQKKLQEEYDELHK